MKIPRHTTKLIVILSLLTPWLSHAEYSISVGVEDFEWTEPSLKLTEQGSRYSLGVSTGTLLAKTNGILYELSATKYKGTIDYDGATQGGDPLTTDTKYDGSKVEGKLAIRVKGIDIAGTLGHERWSRDIKSAKTQSGANGQGYEEKYAQPYLKLGVGYFHYVGTGKGRFEVGYKRPFEVKETIELFDLTLEPKGHDSVYLQYRYQSGKNWGAVIYSEKTHFKESDTVRINNLGFKQPESKSVALGAKLTYRF